MPVPTTNAALFWNDVALKAVARDHDRAGSDRDQGGPTLSSRALGIVHLAMRNGYYAVIGGTPLYGPTTLEDLSIPAPLGSGSTAEATVALGVAALTALQGLYPRQDFSADRAAHDAAFAASPLVSGASGYDHGEKAAAVLLRSRSSDPRGTGVYQPADRTVSHRHQVDPVNPMQGIEGPRHGETKPFVARGAAAYPGGPLEPHRLRAPASFITQAVAGPAGTIYGRSAAQVRSLGAAGAMPPPPTSPQLTSGVFWAFDGRPGVGTPPRFYNQFVIAAADAALAGAGPGSTLSDVQWLDLLTLVNVALADAGIFAWREKFAHDYWRPVIGLNWVLPGNETTSPWRPLGSPRTNRRSYETKPSFTPNFPSYPSGHATFGAAAFWIARRYLSQAIGYQDSARTLNLTIGSDELMPSAIDPSGSPRPTVTRTFNSFDEAIRDNSFSRVHLGVHWDFDGFLDDASGEFEPHIGGVPLGIAVAADIWGASNGGAAFTESTLEMGPQPRPCDALVSESEARSPAPAAAATAMATAARLLKTLRAVSATAPARDAEGPLVNPPTIDSRPDPLPARSVE